MARAKIKLMRQVREEGVSRGLRLPERLWTQLDVLGEALGHRSAAGILRQIAEMAVQQHIELINGGGIK